MIYTRNKESFKTKTVKTSASGSSTSKLSQNGLTLVQELRQRLQNKNKKHQQTVIGQNTSNRLTVTDKPKSSTPKKLTISKNFANNNDQEQLKKSNDCELTHENIKMKQLSLNTHVPQQNVSLAPQNFQGKDSKNHPINNPFSKVKKDSFIQLVNHSSNLGSQFNYEEKPQKKVNQYCESPIKGLNNSNYSSNKSNTVQAQTVIASKQVYENQVKKWGNRTRQNSNNSAYQKSGQTIECQSYQQANPSKTKYTRNVQKLFIISKTVNQNLFLTRASKHTASSSQQEYLQLLETQISTTKHELTESLQQINQLTSSISILTSSNNLLQKQNTILKENLAKVDNQLVQSSQNLFLIQKFERLFEKMRNLLIINAMEMIETKNFLQINFSSSVNSSLANSPQKSLKNGNFESSVKNSIKIKCKPFIDQQDCLSRIQSINQCLARIEHTIQVSQSVVSINRQRQLLDEGQGHKDYSTNLELKQLSQTVKYKDRIITKLREEIDEVKNKLASTKITASTSPAEGYYYNKKNDDLNRTYSFIEEIHLLRYQINRLTQQNCTFYNQYSELKVKLEQKQKSENLKKFPNQQRIIEIESLIKKLDKNQLNQLNNSKLEYWSKTKTDKHRQTSPSSSKNNMLQLSKSKEKLNTVIANTERPKQLDFTKPLQIYKPPQYPRDSHPQILQAKQKIRCRSKQRYSSKGDQIQYSKQEFSELVKEFKSSLSGLTPQKKASFNKDLNKEQILQDNEIIELPTFRTPKSQSKTQHNQTILKSTKQLNPKFELKSSSGELVQQDENNQTEYIETISRLEYEKQFLASERQNLIKENEKLIEKIKELENSKQEDIFSLQKEEIYKLKFQNQELVNRVVQAQNQLIRHQSQSSSKILQKSLTKFELAVLKQRQTKIQSLQKENIGLYTSIKVLENKNQQLLASLNSAKMTPSSHNSGEQQEQLSYILAPSFQQLFTFLKRLPSEKHQYHQILLSMIEGYERKVSQLREENVMIKSKHKELQDFFVSFKDAFERAIKCLTCQKQFSSNGRELDMRNDQKIAIRLNAEIRKHFIKIQEIFSSYFNEAITSSNISNLTQASSQKKVNYQSKIHYHLMFLRSLIQGIGESDLQLIESELSDYLKQLRTRIPTVIERQEYEQSYRSSLNTSTVEDGDDGN